MSGRERTVGHVVEELTWLEGAACKHMDPAVFFTAPGHNAHEAKRVCAGCPVREQCLDYALTTHTDYGVFGGLSPYERVQYRTRMTAPTAVCGTDAGYYRHLRMSASRPCQGCKDAHALAARERLARKSA